MKMAFVVSVLSFISLLSIEVSAQEKYPVRPVADFPGIVMIDENSVTEIFNASSTQPPSSAQAAQIADVLSKLAQSDYCKVAAEYYMKAYRESERRYEADERHHVTLKMIRNCRSVIVEPVLASAAVERNAEMNPGVALSPKWIQEFISTMVAMMMLMPH